MIKALTTALALVLATSTIASAKPRHGHRATHGACDGIHRCTCGSTQTAFFGLPRIYNGHNLWQAIAWVKAFPRTSARAGVVGYQHGGGPTGHVFRIASLIDRCNANVIDERGAYPRNICSRGAVFVEVTKGYTANEVAYALPPG